MKDYANRIYLSTKEVQDILRVCKKTMQRYRNEGLLKYYKFGKKSYRYHIDDVEKFIKQHSSDSILRDTARAIMERIIVKY